MILKVNINLSPGARGDIEGQHRPLTKGKR